MHSPTITRRRTADPPFPSGHADEDRERFAALYARHRDELARYCRSILRHDQDVEDALQSTMAKAFAALQTETREIALRPWLFRIAHNEAISIVRRRVEPVELDDRDGGDPDLVPRTVETRERLRLLRDDLRDLPQRQRSALVLRELSGLGHREIADVLGSSPGAVKQAIYEARCGLGDCAEGRSLTCDRVRRALSDGDGRTAGRRRLRAHLRSCRSCRAFDAALRQRPQDLGALFPAWPVVGAGGAAASLAGLLSGGGTAVGVGSATVGVAATGTGGGLLGGGVLAVSGAAKLAGIAAVAVVAGGGAVAVERGALAGPESGSGTPSAQVREAATPAPSSVRFAGADGDPLVLPVVAPAADRRSKPATGDDPPRRSARGSAASDDPHSTSSRRRSPGQGSVGRPARAHAGGDRPDRSGGQGHAFGRQQSGPPPHAANGSGRDTGPRGRGTTGPDVRSGTTGPAKAPKVKKSASGQSSPATASAAPPAHAGTTGPPPHAASSRPAQADSAADGASQGAGSGKAGPSADAPPTG